MDENKRKNVFVDENKREYLRGPLLEQETVHSMTTLNRNLVQIIWVGGATSSRG